MCFKFHKNRTINEEFDFFLGWAGAKFFQRAPREAEGPDSKNLKMLHTE